MAVLEWGGRHSATRGGRLARQLVALLVLAGMVGMAHQTSAQDAAGLRWPPGWAVEHRDGLDRARAPGAGPAVTIDLVRRTDDPPAALAAATAGYEGSGQSAGFDAGCSPPAPVALGAGRGVGAGCTVTRSGIPLVKSSFVAWAVPGGSAVLAYTAPPGAFEANLPAFGAVVASARAP